jgi:hypothetical protein
MALSELLSDGFVDLMLLPLLFPLAALLLVTERVRFPLLLFVDFTAPDLLAVLLLLGKYLSLPPEASTTFLFLDGSLSYFTLSSPSLA